MCFQHGISEYTGLESELYEAPIIVTRKGETMDSVERRRETSYMEVEDAIGTMLKTTEGRDISSEYLEMNPV